MADAARNVIVGSELGVQHGGQRGANDYQPPCKSNNGDNGERSTAMTTEPKDNVLWTVKDVAAFLQVPERKIWNILRWRSEFDRIPTVELDGKPRFLPSKVREWKEIYDHRLRKMTPQEQFRYWQTLRAASSSSGSSSPRAV
jgi:hypothetical protein